MKAEVRPASSCLVQTLFALRECGDDVVAILPAIHLLVALEHARSKYLSRIDDPDIRPHRSGWNRAITDLEHLDVHIRDFNERALPSIRYRDNGNPAALRIFRDADRFRLLSGLRHDDNHISFGIELEHASLGKDGIAFAQRPLADLDKQLAKVRREKIARRISVANNAARAVNQLGGTRETLRIIALTNGLDDVACTLFPVYPRCRKACQTQ